MDRTPPPATFLGTPFAAHPASLSARSAFLGVPYGVPYDMAGVAPTAAVAPDVVRAASLVYRNDAHTALVVTRLLMIAMGAALRVRR